MVHDKIPASAADDSISNREIRYRILMCLYETYTWDPNSVMTPQEIESGTSLTRDQIVRNIFYLEERGYVQCMKHYGSRLFAAARISPNGIDIVEDEVRQTALFGSLSDTTAPIQDGGMSIDASELLRGLYLAVFNHQSFDTDQRNAIIGDLRALEFELNRVPERRRLYRIRALVEWIHEPLADIDAAARELDLLRGLLRTIEEAHS